MIVADVNLLVFAYRPESDRHESAASWLASTLYGPEEVGLLDVVLGGFLRIVTNSKIFSDPAPANHALSFVEALAAASRARWVPSTPATWRTLRELIDHDRHLHGNMIPDTLLAAITIAHGARLATCDRGFARFPGLNWFDPLTE